VEPATTYGHRLADGLVPQPEIRLHQYQGPGTDNVSVTDRRRSNVPQVDHLIVPTEYQDLNRKCYRARPYSYLSQRLLSLILMVGESEHVPGNRHRYHR
jgi:hypothetical protein